MELTIQQAIELLQRLGVKNYDDYDIQQFIKGYKVELEHGLKGGPRNVTNDDPILTAKITLAHLYEKKNYYELLEQYVESA